MAHIRLSFGVHSLYTEFAEITEILSRYSLSSITHNCRYSQNRTNRTLEEDINIRCKAVACMIFKTVDQDCQFGRCAYAKFYRKL